MHTLDAYADRVASNANLIYLHSRYLCLEIFQYIYILHSILRLMNTKKYRDNFRWHTHDILQSLWSWSIFLFLYNKNVACVSGNVFPWDKSTKMARKVFFRDKQPFMRHCKSLWMKYFPWNSPYPVNILKLARKSESNTYIYICNLESIHIHAYFNLLDNWTWRIVVIFLISTKFKRITYDVRRIYTHIYTDDGWRGVLYIYI